tara:strand:+ start:16583 stop:18010 length:1428 start_codon:yes stop_codon:yes gene_type:complete
MMLVEIEIAVIGSGPGGSMTAALLAEAGKKVALFEKGKMLELSSCTPFSKLEMEQKYSYGGMTAALGKPKVAYVEGSCVGGGSEVNAGLYHRTPWSIIEQWKTEFGLQGIQEEECLRLFEENERDVGVSFMPASAIPPASIRLKKGADLLGWQSMEVPRWYSYNEDGSGVKQSMTQTFIPRALKAGATLYSNTDISSIKKSNTSWVIYGTYLDGDRRKNIKIQAENVFVCAGAINSPVLLKRSGLSKNAGKNLHLHPTIKMVARFPEEVNNKYMGVPVHQIKEFSPRISLGCSISTPPHLTLAMMDIPNGSSIVTSNWKNMAIYYAMTRSGKGSVKNTLVFRDPLVSFNIGDEGVKESIEGLLLLGECLFASGAIELYPVVANAEPVKNMRELRQFVNELTKERLNLMTIHLMSTCAMGEDKNICVTNSYGQVHDHKGLYVNDVSLLCSSLGVNPQGSVMMFVRRNCEFFLQENM